MPYVAVSDNGRQFVSVELKRFSGEMCFTQQTTNPDFAQENDMTERAVQTAKQLLDLKDPVMGLLNFRATSQRAIGVPVTLMGRLLATRLQVVDEQNRETIKLQILACPTKTRNRPTNASKTNTMAWVSYQHCNQPNTVVRHNSINRSYRAD